MERQNLEKTMDYLKHFFLNIKGIIQATLHKFC